MGDKRKAAHRRVACIICATVVIIVILLIVVIYLSTRQSAEASSSPSCQEGTTSMSILREQYGTIDDKEVYRYSLTNKNGVEIKITNYGGVITNILVPDKKGVKADIALGYDSLAEYQNDTVYFGALVGRYANRIAFGKFTLEGKEYVLAKNNGNNSLHGGDVGFSKRIWSSRTDGNKLTMTYVSADGEENFPGQVTATVTFELTEDNRLVLEYNATTTKPTVINLTTHPYFNLGGHDSGAIDDHVMQLNARQYTPLNTESIPTGEVADVAGTNFDLTNATRLGDRFPQMPDGKGFDNNYCFGKTGTRKHMASVTHPKSGRTLDVYSTEPGVQFYTGFYLDKVKGKGGATYNPLSGFCLEAQHYPDSPNEPSFPTTELLPGETYLQTTWYQFGVKE